MSKTDIQDKILQELLNTTKESNEGVKALKSEMVAHQQDYALHQQKTENQLDSLKAEINGLKVELIANTVSLEKHSARSDRLENDNILREQKLRAEVFGEGITDPTKRKHTIHGRLSAIEFVGKWFKVSWVIVAAVMGIASKIAGLW